MSEKVSDMATAAPLTGAELAEIVQTGDNVKVTYSTLKTFFQTPVTGVNAIFCGSMSLSGDVVPTTGGTGTSGAIQAGNFFYISNNGTGVLLGPDGGSVLVGYIAFARTNTPGGDMADKTKWLLISTI